MEFEEFDISENTCSSDRDKVGISVINATTPRYNK